MEQSLFRYIWQHSKRDQLFVLGLILASLPFYWLSLDVPKRIVNEALQGRAFENGKTTAVLFEFSLPLPDVLGGSLRISDGWAFDQLGYLMALSLLFLFFVVTNGAFKYAINISKGMLAERMLRRLRFELFARLMQFRPEYIRAVKPAEAASMINNEVEPVGAFIGDAYIQPAFLGTQALTALLFIIAQSFWLGLVALSVVLIQAFVIPYLRREQLRLGRLRQIASRRLAGRIGEMIDGAGTIHAHGLTPLSTAEIGSRLGVLFNIRADLYKRKFAVKYLNNLLAQITPFFFYAIGGYLALRGSLDIGQLVAVIAAYRDLPPPIKELIDWDQQRADVTIKYEQVISQFTGQPTVPVPGDADATPEIPQDAPIEVNGVTVVDQRGAQLLAGATVTIRRPAHVALVGTSSSGRDILARVLGRQVNEYEGRATIAGHPITALADETAARIFAFVPPDPELFGGTIRDNVLIGLRRRPPEPGDVTDRRWQEACRTGNPLLDETVDWIDYEAAGVDGPGALDGSVVRALETAGMQQELYSYGLRGKLPAEADPELLHRIVEARHALRRRLEREGLSKLVAPFDFSTFNRHATIAENLLFGVIAGERLAGDGRASDAFFQAIVAAEALEQPLIDIGLAIAENSVEVFSDLPGGHPLFDRFSMVKSSDLDEYRELLAIWRSKDAGFRLSQAARTKLMSLALDYVEPRHRLGQVSAMLEARILRARHSFRRYLPHDYATEIEFYDPDAVTMAAPLHDNLLFGRVAQDIANARQKVADVLKQSLPELGLADLVYALGLDFDVGPKGRNLFAPQRAAISLARSLVRRPDVLIIEEGLAPFGRDNGEVVLDRIRECMTGKTLIVTRELDSDTSDFDLIVTFDGARASVSEGTGRQGPAPQLADVVSKPRQGGPVVTVPTEETKRNQPLETEPGE